jgi:hypothetical protein
MIHSYDWLYRLIDGTLGARPEALFQLQCLLIAALGLSCWKTASSRLRRVPGRLWLALGAILLVQAGVLIAVRRPFAGLSEEWEELFLGKLLSEGRLLEFKLMFRHGTTWPMVLSQALRLGAPGPDAAVWLSLGAGVLTTACLFAAGALLLGDPAAGLAASALFAVSPAMLRNSAVTHGKPIAALALSGLAWTALGLCSGGRALRPRCLLALLLAALILLRQELGLYVAVFALGLAILPAGGKKGSARDWLIPAGLLFVFGGFYYVCLANGLDAFVRSASPGATVLDSRADCAGALACAIKFSRISGTFWLSRWEWPALALGAFALAPGGDIPRRPLLLLAGAFLLHNLAYLLHNSAPEERFLVQIYFPFLLLAGAGAARLRRAASSKKTRRGFAVAAVLVLGARASGWTAALNAPRADGYPAAQRIAGRLRSGGAGMPARLVDSRDGAFLHSFAADGLVLSYQDLTPSLSLLGRDDFYWITEERDARLSPDESAVVLALKSRCRVGPASKDGPWTISRVSACGGSQPDYDTESIWDAKKLSDQGVSLYFRGDAAGALERFDRALAVYPRLCDALVSRSALRSLSGDEKGAAADKLAAETNACARP